MTLTENEDGARRGDGGVDARVLGRLLHAMPLLEMLPTAERMAEFLTAALAVLPGVRSCTVRLGEAAAQRDGPRQRPGPAGAATLTSFRLTVPVETGGQMYGDFFLEVHDEPALKPYLPFLTNLAGSVALLTENRLRREHLERALARLGESEARLSDFAHCAADWLWETDANGVYTYSSKRGADLFGFAIGKTPFDFMPPDEAARVAPLFAELMARKAPIVDLENWNMGADGERFCLLTNAVPLLDEAGNLTGYRGADKDITARKWAEAEILHRTAQLEASNKELEAFVYSASHDLRTPLRAIDGFTQMVAEDAGEKLSAADHEHLQRVRTAAQRMAALIDQLLGLARASRGDLLIEQIDVSALATEILIELAADQPERAVETVVAPGMWAQADATLLRAILENLLANAWKFTSKHAAARIEVGITGSDGEQAFYVRDDGAGFDSAYATHLFGPFQRMHAEGQFGGDGIGLATVKRLVTRHGGRVWAEAEVEKGATFYFTLPGIDAEDV